MDDLIAFLRARLDEDEQAALAAHVGPWRAEDNRDDGWALTAPSKPRGLAVFGYEDGPRTARHIARHDPDRVLADVAAKRQIIDAAVRADEAGDAALQTAGEYARAQALMDVVELLALPYADHPDYREEWRP